MSTSILWYATRGAGIVSLLLFTGVVALGILTSGRWQARTWPRFLTAGLHRDISLLSLVFLAIHIVTAVVDPYTALGPLAALVPFAVDYKRFWLGLGAVGLDLIVAIMITSLLRSRFGVRTWRAVHWLSYAAWPLAVLHGIGAGTDTSAFWMQAIDVACVALVVGLATWRLLVEPPAPVQRAPIPRPRPGQPVRAGFPSGAAVPRPRPGAPLPATDPDPGPMASTPATWRDPSWTSWSPSTTRSPTSNPASGRSTWAARGERQAWLGSEAPIVARSRWIGSTIPTPGSRSCRPRRPTSAASGGSCGIADGSRRRR